MSDEVCLRNVFRLLTQLHSKPKVTPKGDVFFSGATVGRVFFFRLFVFYFSYKASNFLDVFFFCLVDVVKRFFRTVGVVKKIVADWI